MTISDLISELQNALENYGDLEVMTSSDYGDICHTEQLADIADVVPCVPVETAYSDSGLAFPGGEDDDDYDDENMTPEERYERMIQVNNRKDKPEVLVLRHTSR